MTESVNFPWSDNSAPENVYIRDDGDDGIEFSCSSDGFALKYLRADTVTPNDQVEEMLLGAFGRGYLAGTAHEDSGCNSVSAAVDEQFKDVISDIRSRYAASNGN